MRRLQALLVGHGALVLCFGLVAGYGFMFSLLGEIALWPLPAIAAALPGDPARWRGAHLGGITNGLMAIGVAAALPLAAPSARAARWIAYGIVLSIWGNVAFYVANALGAGNHALSVGANRLGPGGVLGLIGFFGAYPGAFVAPVVLVMLARAAFVSARDAGREPTA